MRYVLLLMILMFPLSAMSTEAQFKLPGPKTIRIQGKVTDIDSGNPIPGVAVSGPGNATSTRFDGSFTLDLSCRGEAGLWFEKDGYNTHQQTIDGKLAGYGINVKLKQRMGTLYGLLRSCAYLDGEHRLDDLSREAVQVKGQARSGQSVLLTVTPTRDGHFAVFHLPVGNYVVGIGEKTSEVVIERPGDEKTLGLVLRWCMRREYHPEMSEEGISTGRIERKEFFGK